MSNNQRSSSFLAIRFFLVVLTGVSFITFSTFGTSATDGDKRRVTSRSETALNATYHILTPATPFLQDWTNVGLVTANDDWSSVPSIIGYLGDDPATTTAAVDPQTIVVAGTTQDVVANQANPNTATSGGVGEFDGIANPTVAVQGSGTGDYPHIDILLDTSGCASPANSATISYNLRDIDGAADNAIQPVALQYRVGATGDYTNIPGGFVADATTGPSIATLVTPINVALPAATLGQSQVHFRVMTYNATGSDEWVGVDDINVTCSVATAAGVGISGRVMTSDGRGITNAAVTITGNALAEPRTVITGRRGAYIFDDLEPGETYIVTVRSRRFVFSNPSQVISIVDNVSDADFIADGGTSRGR